MFRRILCIHLLFVLALGLSAVGEEEAAPDNRFLLTGYGFTTYVDPGDGPGSFDLGFVPIFLYRVSDRFLFEAELEFEYEDGQLETGMEYAQIDWLANDYLTVVAGQFLTPFGSFIEKLHPAWINKLPTAPLPLLHGQSLVPFSQTGLQLRGGIPLGNGYQKLSYSIFASNGFQVAGHHGDEEADVPEEDEDGDHASAASRAVGSSEDGGDHDEDEGEEGSAPELIFLDRASTNGNGDLALGGRIGIVPAKGFDIGVSYLSGSYDELGNLDATVLGIDFTYHHDLFDVRGEWIDSTTEQGLGHEGDPLADQEIQSWYIQPSLRLSVIPVYAFNSLELVARLANLDWGWGNRDQTSVGLNYYLNGSTIIRLAWERMEETGLEAQDSVNTMFAIGF